MDTQMCQVGLWDYDKGITWITGQAGGLLYRTLLGARERSGAALALQVMGQVTVHINYW